MMSTIGIALSVGFAVIFLAMLTVFFVLYRKAKPSRPAGGVPPTGRRHPAQHGENFSNSDNIYTIDTGVFDGAWNSSSPNDNSGGCDSGGGGWDSGGGGCDSGGGGGCDSGGGGGCDSGGYTD